MEATRKEYRRTALIMALIFLLGVALILLLMSFDKSYPPFNPDEKKLEIDFGGGSTEGAVSEVTNTQEESSNNQPEEPVVTHDDDESPVEKPDDPVSEGSSNNDNNSNSNSNNPSNDFSDIFGGGNSGDGTGDHGNAGEGTGDGPNIGSGSGEMGSGRKLLSKPDSKNPIQATGTVMVKIYVRKDGKVATSRTKVLHNHPKTTSTHKAHWDMAIKLANQYKFEPVSNGHKYEFIEVPVNFYNS